jgi:DNA-binding transcriptional LysR family regulator
MAALTRPAGVTVELRTLRYFVAVAEAGSVTAAAAALHLTQPSLSRQLRQLERQLGIDLFTRDDGRLRLSPAGQAFRPFAERLLAQADQTRAAAAELAAGRMRDLAIAAPATTLTDIVVPFLATLTAGDPMPSIREEVPASVYAALIRGADLAIGTTPAPPGFDSRPLADLPVWAYVPPAHPWAGRTEVDLAGLTAETLLLPTRDYHPRRALDHAVEAARLSYREVHEFTSAEAAQAVAASGRGIAVVSDDARFGLHPLAVTAPDGPVLISLYAAWDRTHYAAATIRTIADRLALFCARRYGDHAD